MRLQSSFFHLSFAYFGPTEASVFNWDCFITCLKFLVVLQSYAVFNLESTLDEFCSYDTMVCLQVQVLNSLLLWFVPLTDLSMATAAKAHGYWSTVSLLPCQKRHTQYIYAEIQLQIIKSSEHKRDIIQWGNTEDSVSTDNLNGIQNGENRIRDSPILHLYCQSSIRSCVVWRMKKRAGEKKIKLCLQFLTSTNLANNCVKWAWLSDCQLGKLQKLSDAAAQFQHWKA